MKSLNTKHNGESRLAAPASILADSPDQDNTKLSKQQTARRAIKIRTQCVADSWSEQERAERLRLGTKRRTWLLNTISQVPSGIIREVATSTAH